MQILLQAKLLHSRPHSPLSTLSFAGKAVQKKDIAIAKNYLSEKELKVLNNIVSAYFDLAEVKAMDEEAMTMQDWLMQFDKLITAFDKKVLTNAGKISQKQAIEKAETEYRKYQEKTISPVEVAYLKNIKAAQKRLERK